MLTATRAAIRKDGATGFPLATIERELPPAKRITLTDALVRELTDLSYHDQRTLTLLRLLFPDHRVRSRLEKDHVVPTSKFNDHQRHVAQLDYETYSEMLDGVNKLPNLQLLEKADNISKHAKMPADWLRELTPTARKFYASQGVKYAPHHLGQVQAFWERRQGFLEQRIRNLLEGTRPL